MFNILILFVYFRSRVLSLSTYGTDGRPNMQDALRAMREEQFVFGKGDRPSASNVAVLLSAGASYTNPEQEARLAKSQGKSGACMMYLYNIALV